MFVVASVVLAVGLVSPAMAQDENGPPPFLESTDLFWTIPIGGGAPVQWPKYPLEADIFPHYVLYGDRHCTEADGLCISMTPGVRLRMHRTESAPIHSPSFIPRANFQWLFSPARNITNSVNFYIGHHSNGQTGCLFRTQRKSSSPCVYDRFPVEQLKHGLVGPDTDDGNFSLFYMRGSLDIGSHNTTRRIMAWRINAGIELTPHRWTYRAMRGLYPRLMGRFGYAVGINIWPCDRLDLHAELRAYQDTRLHDHITATATCLWRVNQRIAVFARVTYGRDDYNSYYFHNPHHKWQTGFTVNHRRKFGRF